MLARRTGKGNNCRDAIHRVFAPCPIHRVFAPCPIHRVFAPCPIHRVFAPCPMPNAQCPMPIFKEEVEPENDGDRLSKNLVN
ncbi:hypothetical protein H6G33_22035 [Calothrix sp. FACHB-1219]|uniref:hypothetical protein n=1 Tax=unclassified Calothrix TaxID=2619626 RepID=UPI001689934B|nr:MULTISPECIES: hypothetical protein [unclassified Calothrix]MBD2206711.1 hypothetical protein [Calothrix sp. FACHB-168]MBD2219701.1 hypothetical protein [Calothrix sp. FACHB-1219]